MVRRLVVTAAVVVLAACTGSSGDDSAGPRVVQPGAPGEPSRELSREEAAEEAAAVAQALAHTEADVAFMQAMLPHHAQALRMTRLVPERTDRDDLPLLAERMDISQEDEIELIRRWLDARDEPVPSLIADHEGHDGGPMPGMLTEAELARLEAAEGDRFDRLFLEFMIRHHEGALVMVEQLYATEGAAADPEIARFASHVYADQQIEISRMRAILAELDGGE